MERGREKSRPHLTMETQLIESTLLYCPKGDGLDHLKIDLAQIYTLESRKIEAATVNKTKAPELMNAMERGYSELSQIIPHVEYELSVAQDMANQRAAIVNLDEAPRILKEKGLVTARNLAGSADMREAVLHQDQEYLKLKDRVEQIKAIAEFLKGKRKGFEMIFSQVKKIYDSLSQYGQLNRGHNLAGSINDEEVSAEDNISSVSNNIGSPRY